MNMTAKLNQAADARAAEIAMAAEQRAAALRSELHQALREACADLCATLHHETSIPLEVIDVETPWAQIDGGFTYEHTIQWLAVRLEPQLTVAVRRHPAEGFETALIKTCYRCHQPMAVRVIGPDGWIDAWAIDQHTSEIPCAEPF